MSSIIAIIVLVIASGASTYHIYWRDLRLDWFRSLKKGEKVRADYALYGGSGDYVILEGSIGEKYADCAEVILTPIERALAIKQFGPDGLLITTNVHWQALRPLKGNICDQDCFKCHDFILFKLWTLKKEKDEEVQDLH